MHRIESYKFHHLHFSTLKLTNINIYLGLHYLSSYLELNHEEKNSISITF
jgi:hypothetical protein